MPQGIIRPSQVSQKELRPARHRTGSPSAFPVHSSPSDRGTPAAEARSSSKVNCCSRHSSI